MGSSEALAGEQPDVNITTGGTGPSGTDHLRRAVAALGGRLLLDGIAMRPGHPAVLAELPDGRFVVGLPGNPLAAMMALTTLAEPSLAALGNRSLRAVGQAISGADIDPDRDRTRLIPCKIVHGLAFPISHTGPGMMRGLAWADGIIAVPPWRCRGRRAGSCAPPPLEDVKRDHRCRKQPGTEHTFARMTHSSVAAVSAPSSRAADLAAKPERCPRLA